MIKTKRSKESREKMSKIAKEKGFGKWMSGKHHSEETKQKMSKSRKGKKKKSGYKIKDTNNMKGTHPKTEFKKGMIPWNKGKKLPPHSEETKRKMSRSHPKGKNHPNWKGGIFKKNPYERKLFLNTKRRVIKLKAVGSHTQGEWELLKKQYGYTCPACGKSEPKIKLTQDHVIPLVKGGSDFIENIQPLCKSCNSQKHTDITDYRRSI